MFTLKLVSHSTGADGRPESQVWIPGVNLVKRIGTARSDNAYETFLKYSPIDHDYIVRLSEVAISKRARQLRPGEIVTKPDGLHKYQITKITDVGDDSVIRPGKRRAPLPMSIDDVMRDARQDNVPTIEELIQHEGDKMLFEPSDGDRICLHLESLSGESGEVWSVPPMQVIDVHSEESASVPVSLLWVDWIAGGDHQVAHMLVEKAFLLGPDGGTIDRIAT